MTRQEVGNLFFRAVVGVIKRARVPLRRTDDLTMRPFTMPAWLPRH